MLLLLKSELVEGDDIDGLDIILELHDLLFNNICRNLIVLDGGANLDLEDTEGNRLLLPLSFPEETVHLDAENLVSKGVEISLLTPWLHIPDKEGLGDGGGLLLLVLGLFSLLLEGLGGSGIVIAIEEIVEIFIRGGGLGGFLLASLLSTFFTSFLALYS